MTGGGAGAQTPTLPPSLTFFSADILLLTEGHSSDLGGQESKVDGGHVALPRWKSPRSAAGADESFHDEGDREDEGGGGGGGMCVVSGPTRVLMRRHTSFFGEDLWCAVVVAVVSDGTAAVVEAASARRHFHRMCSHKTGAKVEQVQVFALKVSQNKKSVFFFSLINKSLTHQKKMSVNYDFCVVEKNQQFCDRLPMDFIYPFKQ